MIVGIGVDECEVDRMRAAIAKTPSMRTRLFTADELTYSEAAPDEMAYQRLAARFAAKEAFLKSLGQGLGACRFVDIEVARDHQSGRPHFVLHDGAAALGQAAGVEHFHLSMTHTSWRATAFVIAETA